MLACGTAVITNAQSWVQQVALLPWSSAGHSEGKVFDDSSMEVEIKPVVAPRCRSLITTDYPDLEETRVTLPIRRDDSPPPKQLSHDTPINLFKRIPPEHSEQSIKSDRPVK